MPLSLLSAIVADPAIACRMLPSLDLSTLQRAFDESISHTLAGMATCSLAAQAPSVNLLSRIWPQASSPTAIMHILRAFIDAAAKEDSADPEVRTATLSAYSAVRSYLSHSILKSPSRTPYIEPTRRTTEYTLSIYDQYISTLSPDGTWPDATPLQAIHRCTALDNLLTLPGRRINYPAIHRATTRYLLTDEPTPDPQIPTSLSPGVRTQIFTQILPLQLARIQARSIHSLDLESPYAPLDLTLLDPNNIFPSLLEHHLKIIINKITSSPQSAIPTTSSSPETLLALLYTLHTQLSTQKEIPA